MNRSNRKYFRVSDEELALIDKRAGSQQTSAYIRACVLGRPPIQIPEVNKLLVTELGKIGTNLNQLARKLNAAPPTKELVEQVAAETVKVRNAIIHLHIFDDES